MKINRFPISTIFIGIVTFIMIVYISFFAPSIMWDGFAVDKNGLLYISQTGKIDVIDQGEIVKEISAHTTRGFLFTIENGDILAIYTGARSYKLDLEGTILEETDALQNFNDLGIKSKGPFTALNGFIYYMRSPWGRPQIVLSQNGVEYVIYQMPIRDYLARIMILLISISLCYIAIAIFKWKYHKQKKKKKKNR